MSMTLSRRTGPLERTDRVSTEFDALFQNHWERLCRSLYRLLGDWDEAQDLALETFERLHRNPPRDPAYLQAWLYRVATNLGYNALRARRRRLHYEIQAGSQALESNEVDPAAEAERRIQGVRVRRVLSEMKPRSAQLLLLRHSGLTYAELAAALDLSPASVGTLLARAEAEFEKLYRQHDPDI